MPVPPPSVEPIDQRPQLRVAAAIALASALCLLPLQAFTVDARQLPALLVIYVIHTAVAGFVLLASFTGLGARRGDGLGLLLVLGLASNLLLYLYLLPYAVPTYPSLMSSAFTTLLIAGAVLIETFIVAPGVAMAPVVHDDGPFPDADMNPATPPVHTYHLGLWFNSPDDAAAAGCANTVTPFNGDHTAGIQVLNTSNFPDDQGPLRQLVP